MDTLAGYRGQARALLERFGVVVGDLVVASTTAGDYQGVLLPRYELADDRHVVLKLASGYNVGLRAEKVQALRRLSAAQAPAYASPRPPPTTPGLPRVAILSTGGTIASRVDYRTGGVTPALTAGDLYATVPELTNIAQVEAEVLLSLDSENMTPTHWSVVAAETEARIKQGVNGVVITHGTDTLGYTAAALSFGLKGTPVPVVLVGAQRSSDRPSSDAAANLLGAVTLASRAPFSGVYVVMHSGMSDDALAVHSGVKVRKNHTSRRDAFESVNAPPVAYLRNGAIQATSAGLPPRGDTADFHAKTAFSDKAALVKSYPGFEPALIEALVARGCRGVILEGSGLGHIATSSLPALRRAVDDGTFVGMTSQCLWGRVRMTVYDTGRELMALGVTPLEDMLPETALAKLSWVLAHYSSRDEIVEQMRANLVGEYAPRSLLDRRPAR
jgi:glutamyl-tRNA(Gln) amidotransferase subunit D